MFGKSAVASATISVLALDSARGLAVFFVATSNFSASALDSVLASATFSMSSSVLRYSLGISAQAVVANFYAVAVRTVVHVVADVGRSANGHTEVLVRVIRH